RHIHFVSHWGGLQEPCCLPIMEQRRSTSRTLESAEDGGPRNHSRSRRRASARADGPRPASGARSTDEAGGDREAAPGDPLDAAEGVHLREHRALHVRATVGNHRDRPEKPPSKGDGQARRAKREPSARAVDVTRRTSTDITTRRDGNRPGEHGRSIGGTDSDRVRNRFWSIASSSGGALLGAEGRRHTKRPRTKRWSNP